MRPPEKTDDEIIKAGRELVASGERVTGFRLRRKLGGGDTKRMFGIWKAATANDAAEAQPANVELPIEIEDALTTLSAQVEDQLRLLAGNINAIAARLAERRVAEIMGSMAAQATLHAEEMDDANRAVDDLELKIDSLEDRIVQLNDELSSERSKTEQLSSELGMLRERGAKLNDELAASQAELNLAKEGIESRERELRELSGKLSVAEDRLNNATAELGLVKRARDQGQLVNDALADKNNDLKQQIASLTTKLAADNERLYAATQRCDELRTEANRIAEANRTLTMAMDQLRDAEQAAATALAQAADNRSDKDKDSSEAKS